MAGWRGIPFALLGGRKFVVAIWLSSLATGLAACGQFTDGMGLLFGVIYGGFTLADARINTAAITKGVHKEYGAVAREGDADGPDPT